MRHRKIRSRLNRTSEHRQALMRNLAMELIRHERIHTTQVKAMQLRSFVEPLVTLARAGDLHSRRLAFSRLQKKEPVHKLFEDLGPRCADRDGGYTRVVKDGPRAGDGAMMAYIEFVDEAPVEAGEGGAAEVKTMKRRLHEKRKEMRKARR